MEYKTSVIQSKYQVVPRTLIFIERDDEVLLIHKSKRDSYGFSKLNGIGGHIEKGEEPNEAAKREIFEESGLVIKHLSLVAIIFIDIGTNPGILLFVYKAKYQGGNLKESDEGGLVWMKRTSLKDTINLVKDINFLLELTDSYKENSPPVFVKYLYDENRGLRIVT
jgi:8-oxo-dGTP diphosphatase